MSTAPLLIAAPAANADTGSSSINLGRILQALSAESPTADCDPPQIPATTPQFDLGRGGCRLGNHRPPAPVVSVR
ncbi:hypothetical protein [Nocardia mangyaensis]|uniref:hypothetical protein n=1 Tax=Nocardia mangyaensis TaxID=2213200 RepID=UPI0012EB64D1|nr:hypothetical protein [Nocardia mangyaensis]